MLRGTGPRQHSGLRKTSDDHGVSDTRRPGVALQLPRLDYHSFGGFGISHFPRFGAHSSDWSQGGNPSLRRGTISRILVTIC